MKKLNIVIILICITMQINAQPCTKVDELNRKRHIINGMTYGHPYTMFDRHNGLSLEQTIENIRNQIIFENDLPQNSPKPVYSAYKLVYEHANGYLPPNAGKTQDDGLVKNKLNNDDEITESSPSDRALWAKNCAFVFLVGLDGNGNELNLTQRETFKYKALQAFDNLNGEIANFPFQKLTKHQFYSRSLISWLQAYDLLKASAALPELDSIKWENNFDSDANKGICHPRNKLRKLTRDLYLNSIGPTGIVTHKWGWKKNHGIACAAAILMAAQVLNDAGVETDFGNIAKYAWIPFLGIGITVVRALTEPWPHPNYSPINWNKLGTEGLKENIFEGKHWWPSEDNPVAPYKDWADAYSPYSEGPAYAHYGLLDCAIPAMRTQQNFYPNWANEPLLISNEINNIFNWVNDITIGNSLLPTYDNSGPGNHSFYLALTNKRSFNYGAYDGIKALTSDYIALVGGNNIQQSISKKPEASNNLKQEGNIILRTHSDTANYYFHMLAEEGMAVDKSSGWWGFGGSHEDDDLGSFMISAGNDLNNMHPLIIDPPYFGWNEVESTNKFFMHNVLNLNNSNAIYHINEKSDILIKSINSNFKIKSFNLGLKVNAPLHSEGSLNRIVNEINYGNNVYYLLNDIIDIPQSLANSGVTFVLNGNGRNDFLSTYSLNHNLHTWSFPCKKQITGTDNWEENLTGWKISSNTIGIGGSTLSRLAQVNTYASNNASGTKANIGIPNNFITRFNYTQFEEKTVYQTVLFPQKCTSELPLVSVIDDNPNFVATFIRFIDGYDTTITRSLYPSSNPSNMVNDTSSHFHYARFNGMEQDSVQNPFNLPNQSDKWVQLDAQKAFLRHQTMAMAHGGFKYCPPSYLNLRYAGITNGSYVKFNDTFLIQSSIPVNAAIGFTGRYTYSGSIKPITSPTDLDTIRFYLADVGKGVDMVAFDFLTRNELGCRYDSFSNTIAIKIPVDFTNITIEQRDKCNDCYFPPSYKGIDTLFTIDDGLTHTLGHKLSVKSDFGNLHLSNGSRLDMCPEVYLCNRDTIIIEGPAQTKEMILPNCYGIDSLKSVSSTSAIVVKSGSALVLDSGSFTYVKNGGAIYVKQNGSLLIKNGAFLQIGDSGSLGWGEIIAEQGAFIHIEPLAHIEYRTTVGDTVDRNLFVLGGGSNNAAFHGVYFLIDTVLKLDTVMPIHYSSTAICALDSVNPVKNKFWGYTNFAKPLATFTARNDTLCPREPLHIKLNRILNDAQAQIKVCRMDSMLLSDSEGGIYWQDTCIEDSIIVDLIPPDPVCKPPRQMPDEWTYYFKPNTLNRVTISAVNDCGMRHDTVAYIFASDTPRFYIDVPDSVCEGVSPLVIRVFDYNPIPVKYSIAITEFFADSFSLVLGLNKPAPIYSFDGFGSLPDSFVVNDYFFKGGRKYLVSFTIQNECSSFDAYDTVSVPSGVFIKLSRPTVYASPINGATSVQLNGYISVADSFRWEPVTWLNRTDTNVVVSTPEDAINYVLIAKYGECTSTDTAIIKYNRVANAGVNDTLCFTNDTALLGNSYDMSIFLGFLYYKGGTDFYNMFSTYTSNDPAYFRYLSHFLMHDEIMGQWLQCGTPIMDRFKNQLFRRQIMRQPWFKAYYTQLTEFNSSDMAALDAFVAGINSNYELASNMDAQGDWAEFEDCATQLFDYYDDFVVNHLDEISSTWVSVANGDTSVLSVWDEYFVAAVNPTVSTSYIQTVITPQFAEIDEVTVFRDTILAPLFYPAMQFDSTVYFANLTNPFSAASSYSWNFGDGSSLDNNPFPIHTFPAFDSSYIVCLTAFNKCGSFMYCDTIRIDSASLSNQRVVYNKRAGLSNQADNALNSDKQVVNVINRPEIFLANYPNPFGDKTVIDYQIWQTFSNASLIITNTLGQVVFEKKLFKPIDKVSVDGNLFSNGLYYYSIVIDNSTKLTKMMSVMH